MQRWLKVIVAKIPVGWRRAAYRSPLVARLLRSLLNRVVGQGFAVVEVSAGPLKGAKLKLNMQTEKYYWLGTHEPLVQEWLVSHVKTGMTIYDAGSHLGYFSLMMARLAGSNGHVVAFEPDPANFARLSHTVEINQAHTVEAVNSAVTQHPGSVEMEAGRETMSYVVTDAVSQPGQKMVSVAATSLDAWVFDQGHAAPDLIKIDVEGHEKQALLGARRVLESHAPLVLCEVHHAQAGQSVWRILQELGYSMFHLESGKQAKSGSDIEDGHVAAFPAVPKTQAARVSK